MPVGIVELQCIGISPTEDTDAVGTCHEPDDIPGLGGVSQRDGRAHAYQRVGACDEELLLGVVVANSKAQFQGDSGMMSPRFSFRSGPEGPWRATPIVLMVSAQVTLVIGHRAAAVRPVAEDLSIALLAMRFRSSMRSLSTALRSYTSRA